MEKFSKAYMRFCRRFWPLVLIASVALCVPAFQRTVQLFKNIDTDLTNLLPDNYLSVKLIEQMRKKFTAGGNLWVILEGPNREQILKFIPDLVERLEDYPEVREVVYKKPGYDFFDEHKLLYLSLADLKDIRERVDRRIQREKLGNLYINLEDEEPESFDDLIQKYESEYSSGVRSRYYESDDGKVFMINVFPKGTSSDFSYADKFYKHIVDIVANTQVASRPPALKVYYAGSIRTRVDEYKSLISDLAMAGIVATIGILLLLLVIFRGLRPLLMVLAPLFVGMLYTFGLASLFVDGFNTVTAFLFAIMMGLGIDFGIHMVSRYMEERSHGAGIDEATTAVLNHVGRASFTSATTTATAFFLLLVVDFKGFTEFGLIAGIGVLTSMATYWLLLPAWIRLLEKFGPIRRAPVPLLRFMEHWKTFPHPRLVLAITGGITLVSILLLPWVGFEYDYGKLRAHFPEAEKARLMEEKVRQRRPNPAMVLLHDREEANAVKTFIDKEKEEPGSLIDSFASIYSLVPEQQEEKLAVMADIDDLLDDDVLQKVVKGKDKEKIREFQDSLDVTGFDLADVPQAARDSFIGEASIPGTVGLIVLKPGIETHDGRNAMKLAADVENMKTPMGLFHATNEAIIFGNVLKVMLKETRVAVPLAFLGVFLLLVLDFRNPKKVIAVLIPWISGVLWMSIAIVGLDLKLNFYNVFIPAAVFGMGIDYAVHFVHRYSEDPRSVMPALRSTGGSIIAAGLTTIMGFSGLALANHRGLQSMGLLAIVGIASCMICSLTMLPAAITVLKSFRSNRNKNDDL